MSEKLPDLLANPPEGFKLIAGDPELDFYLIEYKRPVKLFSLVFLSGFLVIWTVACIAMTMMPGLGMPAVFPVLFWITDLLIVFLLLYTISARRLFRLDSQSLTAETQLANWRWKKEFARASITALRIVYLKGDSESSPSWSLHIQADKSRNIFTFGDSAPVQWLSGVIAAWAGVEAGGSAKI